MQFRNLFINSLRIKYPDQTGMSILHPCRPEEAPDPGPGPGKTSPASTQGDAGVGCPHPSHLLGVSFLTQSSVCTAQAGFEPRARVSPYQILYCQKVKK